MKVLPYWLTFAVSVGAGFAGGEFLGFPWWLRLITVVAVTFLMQGANELMVRSRARRKGREGHTGH